MWHYSVWLGIEPGGEVSTDITLSILLSQTHVVCIVHMITFTYQWYNRHSHIRKLNTACVESADKHLHKDKILTLITIHNIHWGCSQYRLSKMSKSLKKYLIYILIYTPADIHQHPHVHCHCVSWSPPSLEQLQPEENIITYKFKMSCVQPVLQGGKNWNPI